MNELKRVYVVPLRRKTIKAPKWRRSKKALSVLKEFVKKHMKCENLVVLNEVNEFIWKHGIKNPPGKIEIVSLKKTENDKTKVYVALKEDTLNELFKPKEEEKQVEEKKEENKNKKEEKIVEAKEVKEEDKSQKKEEVKEEDKSQKKEEVKEEDKSQKKEEVKEEKKKEEKQNINKNENSKKSKEDKK